MKIDDSFRNYLKLGNVSGPTVLDISHISETFISRENGVVQ